MTLTATHDASANSGVRIARKWFSLYWIVTLYVALTSFGAGVADILRASPLFEEVLRLGYPPHFSTLLGVWKVLGAIALLVPRYPLLKEWAYAGMFFDFSSAMVAHASAGDGFVSYTGPVLSIGAMLASWYLRPESRRLAGTHAASGLIATKGAVGTRRTPTPRPGNAPLD